MTGAPVPAGAEAVIMQEQAEISDAGVRFTAEVQAGQNIRLAGKIFARVPGFYLRVSDWALRSCRCWPRSASPRCRWYVS